MNMLNRTYQQYIITPQKMENLWTQGYVLFARLKNHTIIFIRAKKERMDIQNNARYVVLQKVENITKNVLKFVLLNMKDGLREILIKFLSIRELIIIGIKKKSWKSSKNLERKMDMRTQKHTGKGTKKRLHATIMWLWQSSLVILYALKHAIGAKIIVRHKLITMIIQSPWKLFGFVANVMEKSIEQIYQRERLNPMGAKAHAIVRSTQRKVLRLAEMTNPFFPRGNKAGYGIQRVVRSIRANALQTTFGCKTSDQPVYRR